MARRARFGEAATIVIGVRVTPAQRKALEQAAKDNQTDLSGAIRDAVNDYVADYRDDDPVFRCTEQIH